MAEDTGKKYRDGTAIMTGQRLRNQWETGLIVVKDTFSGIFFAEKSLGGSKKIQYKVKGGEVQDP